MQSGVWHCVKNGFFIFALAWQLGCTNTYPQVSILFSKSPAGTPVPVEVESQIVVSGNSSRSAAVGTTLLLEAVVLDKDGNSQANIDGIVWTHTGSGTLISGTTMTNSQGKVSASLTLNNPGLNTISVEVPGIAVPAIFQITGFSAAQKLFFLQEPSSSGNNAGKIISPFMRVAVQDSNGNTVTNVNTGTVSLAGNPAGIQGLLVQPIVNGVAIFFGVYFNSAGSYTITATSSGFTDAITSSFNVDSAIGDIAPAGGVSTQQKDTDLITYLSFSVTAPAVAPDDRFSVVSVGDSHTCGITWNGNLRCWGANQFGQLGIGTQVNSVVAMTVDPETKYQKITTGGFHTCGITVAGFLKCWGFNLNGELGDGTGQNSLVPKVIDESTTYKAVTAGFHNTCAITTADILKCWGNNQYNQVGNNSNFTAWIPKVVDAGVNYLDVSPGFYHTCGITTSKKLKCWGGSATNTYLGVDSNSRNSKTPILIDSSVDFKMVSAGYRHICALTDAGQVKCWGYNVRGVLGTGDTAGDEIYVPKDIADASIYKSISSTMTTDFNTCGITSDNKLKCWGSSGSGLFGVDQLVPVERLASVSFVSSRSGHTCIISSITNYLTCLGSNQSGQLGNSETSVSVVSDFKIPVGLCRVQKPLPGSFSEAKCLCNSSNCQLYTTTNSTTGIGILTLSIFDDNEKYLKHFQRSFSITN